MENREVIKRGGAIVPFDIEKIYNAIDAAFKSVGEEYHQIGKNPLLKSVIDNTINVLYSKVTDNRVSVEDIQDAVEECFFCCGHYKAGKRFVLYREEHKDARMLQERLDYMDEYINSNENAATSSETDANANVSFKNVANLDGEVYKTTNRLIQRMRMKKKLSELFPEVRNQYAIDLRNHIIYVHDEASAPTIKNYCEAVTLYPLAQYGTGPMDGVTPSAPQHLESFAGQIANLLFLLSAQCKGAVAFGEFFNFFDYYAAKDFGEDYHLRENEFVDTEVVKRRRTIGDRIDQTFQQIVYYWNQPAGNRSYQSPFSNISYYDSNYWHALFDDFYFPDGTKPSWERVSWLQKRFMKWFNKERTKTMLTFPVETLALLTDGKDVLDKEYKEFAAEMYAEGHSFFTYLSDNPDALASCCRLRNEMDSNTFSFTNGLTGVQTGSCNVITLNINRIIQDYFKSVDTNYFGASGVLYKDITEEDISDFRTYLINILERVYKYHIAYKTLLYEAEERGMLTASTAGYISMKKLYCTIGINGINEAAEFVGIDCNYNEAYMEFCDLINSTISEENRKHSTPSFRFNLEYVPAEGLSSKNYNWDKADGYKVPEDRNLYNSYFYLAGDPYTTVLDRFRLHGRNFTSKLDGGVGLHCNLEDHLSKEQYLKLIDFAIAEGTSYFTFNVPNCQCDQCNHIEKHHFDVCPKCGSQEVTDWTRVIGFLRPVKKFDKYRRWEAENKRVYTSKEDAEFLTKMV